MGRFLAAAPPPVMLRQNGWHQQIQGIEEAQYAISRGCLTVVVRVRSMIGYECLMYFETKIYPYCVGSVAKYSRSLSLATLLYLSFITLSRCGTFLGFFHRSPWTNASKSGFLVATKNLHEPAIFGNPVVYQCKTTQGHS